VRQDGTQLLLKVEMAEPLKAVPGNWSVVEPPRVVFDFPEAENKTGTNSVAVGTGDLKGMNLVQTEKLTRLVLNLYRPTRYSAELDGKTLFIKLDTLTPVPNAESAPSAFQPKAAPVAAKAKASTDAASVRDVIFRRGEDGQAIIMIDLTDGSVPVDVRRSGNGLIVDLADAELPERLQNKRDVTDFATPVTSVTSRAVGGATKFEIAARGKWFHQAQLANNQLTIEVKPIPADEANKLVQSGQQGQKVSINFFDADATMILRTLADISGKNVMIDPSLAGRRITISLDNISYDQALDIVMGQVNAAMRLRNDVILFGDRAVLQQRDQAAADEAARANDTAPIVSETFTLSYIKPTEIAGLIRANIAQAGPGGAAAPAAGQAAAAPAAAGGAAGAAQAGGGMLSARGSMATHDLTKKLFVRDITSVIESIREVIREVDIPQKQVLIEARIVEASTTFNNTLGMRLRGFTADTVANAGYQVPGTNTTRAALGTTTGFTNTDTFGAAAAPALARSSTQIFGPSYSLAAAANMGLMLFNRAGTKLLALELQASETDQKTKVVSSPRIVTMDRKAATINNSQQVTINTGINATTGLPIWQTFAAPLTLTVTPSINPDDRISLELAVAKSTITNASTGSLDTNTVTTNVIVENGGTVVIGGFTRESENVGQDRVPFFGDLPYVGFLFKTSTKAMARSELMVFITPRILSAALAGR
jgi:type IV pilus assembly protein PilQ